MGWIEAGRGVYVYLKSVCVLYGFLYASKPFVLFVYELYEYIPTEVVQMYKGYIGIQSGVYISHGGWGRK